MISLDFDGFNISLLTNSQVVSEKKELKPVDEQFLQRVNSDELLHLLRIIRNSSDDEFTTNKLSAIKSKIDAQEYFPDIDGIAKEISFGFDLESMS